MKRILAMVAALMMIAAPAYAAKNASGPTGPSCVVSPNPTLELAGTTVTFSNVPSSGLDVRVWNPDNSAANYNRVFPDLNGQATETVFAYTAGPDTVDGYSTTAHLRFQKVLASCQFSVKPIAMDTQVTLANDANADTVFTTDETLASGATNVLFNSTMQVLNVPGYGVTVTGMTVKTGSGTPVTPPECASLIGTQTGSGYVQCLGFSLPAPAVDTVYTVSWTMRDNNITTNTVTSTTTSSIVVPIPAP